VSYAIVRIVWNDAFAETSSWIEVDSIDDKPCEVTSVGFLIPEAKKDHVVLAQSVNVEESIDSVLMIPVAMIVSTELLS
jgi:hypothetical protein